MPSIIPDIRTAGREYIPTAGSSIDGWTALKPLLWTKQTTKNYRWSFGIK
jgi:hypothetical protein